MGERYDVLEEEPKGASLGNDSGDEDDAWAEKIIDELPASKTSSAVKRGVVGDSPQRELATIRQQIKSMQAARKTRATVLHGQTAHGGAVGW